MESEEAKKFLRGVQAEIAGQNARMLMQRINKHCFEYCVPTPGSSLSSGEEQCVKSCMEKYIKAWNEVNNAYVRRLQHEVQNGQQGF